MTPAQGSIVNDQPASSGSQRPAAAHVVQALSMSGDASAGSTPARMMSALGDVDQLPRVGVVVTQFGYGGAEKQTFELLRMLKGTSWQPVGVYCLSNQVDPYGSALRALGYRLVVIPRQFSYDPLRLLMLRRALDRDGVTMVHGVHLLASAYAWLATRGPIPYQSCPRCGPQPCDPVGCGPSSTDGCLPRAASSWRTLIAARSSLPAKWAPTGSGSPSYQMACTSTTPVAAVFRPAAE